MHPQHYKEKLIKELAKDDTLIAIAGHPLVIKENSLLLDDGSSAITVYFDSKPDSNAKFIRVFGIPVTIDGNIALQADFIQDLSKIDIFLYKEVRKLLKK